MTTRFASFFTAFILFAAVLAADDFISTWKAPDATPMMLSGKKVAVLIVSRQRSARIAAEETLARAITAHGAVGITAADVIPESELTDKEKTKSRLNEAGAAAIIVIQPEVSGNEKLSEDVLKDPRYQNFWGYYSKDWEVESSVAKSQKNVKIYIETKVYSLEQDKLVWMGTSVTKAGELVPFIDRLTGSIVTRLQEQGLLQK